MVTSDELLRELPSLRRYARALAGTQQGGDQLVSRLLQQVSEEPTLLESGRSLKVSLFQAFTRLLEATLPADRLSELESKSETKVDESLSLLTPRPRQAFLLTAVEGFSAADAGTVLGVTAEEVDQLIFQVREEIADQTATSCLIIEDELFIATQLEKIVTDLGHVVLDMVRTRGEAAIALARAKENLLQPGIVLADVQLADGSSGIDAVRDILGSVECPVIFITAFPARLLTSRTVEPTFILSKPFTEDSVKAVITQALFFQKNAVVLS